MRLTREVAIALLVAGLGAILVHAARRALRPSPTFHSVDEAPRPDMADFGRPRR